MQVNDLILVAGRGADRRRYERFAREEMLRRGLDPDAT